MLSAVTLFVLALWFALSYAAAFGVGVVFGIGLTQRYRVLRWWGNIWCKSGRTSTPRNLD